MESLQLGKAFVKNFVRFAALFLADILGKITAYWHKTIKSIHIYFHYFFPEQWLANGYQFISEHF